MTTNEGTRARVVAIRDADKFSALEQVLDQTRFFDVLERRWGKSGKSKEGYGPIL